MLGRSRPDTAQAAWGHRQRLWLGDRLRLRRGGDPQWMAGRLPGFWAERRLLPEAGRLPGRIASRLGTLATHLADLLPQRPPASLLHGDLWGGNVLVDGDRVSGLIDPACYYGHGEVDLAMLSLFGNPSGAFWTAYGGPESGWERRRGVVPARLHRRALGS